MSLTKIKITILLRFRVMCLPTLINSRLRSTITCKESPSQYYESILTDPSGVFQNVEYIFKNGLFSAISFP
jgi:hypothetical protein